MDLIGVAILIVLIGGPLLWIVSLVDAARQPHALWAAAGRSRTDWILRLVLAGWVAGLFYWLYARRDLVRARAELHE